VTFVAQVLVGRFEGHGAFRFLRDAPLMSIGFLEAFALATVVGLCLRVAAAAEITWPFNALAALTHAILMTVNVTHWGFYRMIDAEFPGVIATAMHGVLVVVELAAARRNRARLLFH
jgi:hypothetical protein